MQTIILDELPESNQFLFGIPVGTITDGRISDYRHQSCNLRFLICHRIALQQKIRSRAEVVLGGSIVRVAPNEFREGILRLGRLRVVEEKAAELVERLPLAGKLADCALQFDSGCAEIATSRQHMALEDDAVRSQRAL